MKLQNVLNYLQKNGSASKLELLNHCRYSNGGDAIFRLRNRGHIIDRIWEYSSADTKYARYIYKGKRTEREVA